MVSSMCLILLAYDIHPDYRLILAANRDEFYNRPTMPMAFWEDHPDILAGKDLKGGGTWLGITRSGKFSAITNYREPGGPKPDAPSRGYLVSDFLSGNSSSQAYVESVSAVGHTYSGFNLIVGDASGVFYHSNRKPGIQRISPGWHGLSNHLLDSPWPKVVKGIALLKSAVSDSDAVKMAPIFQLLKNREVPQDNSLPKTGVGVEWERKLSPMFIQSPGYGTRSSTVVLIGRNGKVLISELTHITGSGQAQRSPFLRSFQLIASRH
jgi:uncharacterized protein with NRDE domain